MLPIIYELRKKESANKKVGYFEDIACTSVSIVLRCTHAGRKMVLEKRINELQVIKTECQEDFS